MGLTCLLEMQQQQGKFGMEKQDLSYSSLMWQCASTLQSAKTILTRANLNSIKYYKITHIDSNRNMSVTEDKSSDNNIVKKQGLEDMTTTESDSSLDSDHSLGQFDLHHQLDEDCQMIDEEINYPSYPVHFY